MGKHLFLRQILEYRDPHNFDDINEGYQVGQPWANQTEDLFNPSYWVCVDNSPGNARWLNLTLGVIRVEFYIDLDPDEYDNKIVYCETTQQVFYSNGEIWIRLSWEILEVPTTADLPDLTTHIAKTKYKKTMAWTKDTELLYYCPEPGGPWIIVSLRYFTGRNTFNGTAGKTIVHNLGVIPGYVGITPFGDPAGAGNIWYRNLTPTSVTIFNDSEYRGEFLWFVIEEKDLGATNTRTAGNCAAAYFNVDVPSEYYGQDSAP